MQARAVAHSTLWQIASQGVMAVLSVATSKFVTLALTKELAGNYISAYGFLQIFAILADFGLYAVAVREVSRAPDAVASGHGTAHTKDQVLGALFLLRIIITTCALGSAVALVWLLPQWRGTPFPIGVTIAALVPGFTLLAGMLRTVFQVRYKMQFVFLAETLQRVVTTGCIGLFLFLGFRDSGDLRLYETFLWIGGIGAAVLFLLSLFHARRLMPIRLSWDPVLLKRVLLLAAPYGLAYLCMALYRQLDVVFLNLLRPDFAIQNAYYGIAGRVEDMAFLVPTFLLNSVLPMLSAHGKNKEQDATTRTLLGKTMFILLLTGATFFLFATLWARPLTLLLAKPDYLSSALHPGSDQAFWLMSVPMCLNGLILYSFYVLLTGDAWRRLVAVLAAGAVISVVLNLLWVPAHGFAGTGSALTIVHVLVMLALLPQALRMRPITLTRDHLRALAIFCIPLGMLLWLSAPVLVNTPRIVLGATLALGVMAGLAWLSGLRRLLGDGA